MEGLSVVIPGAATAANPESITPVRILIEKCVLDSGFAGFARAPE